MTARRWTRGDGRAVIPFLIDRAHTKEVIILGHSLHGVTVDIADRTRVGPYGFSGISPDNFVTRDVGFLVRVPFDCSVVG